MTLGGVLRGHMQLIAWCHSCLHQVEPDIATLVEHYGPEMECRNGVPGCAAPNAAAVTAISSCRDIRRRTGEPHARPWGSGGRVRSCPCTQAGSGLVGKGC